jgi:peptide/nickel transport system permease protein
LLDYALKRILLIFPTLLIGSALLFFSMRTLPPRDAVELKIGDEALFLDPELADIEREKLGIHGPLHEQYFRWITGFVTGDWGKSLASYQPIFGELKNRIPVSFELSFAALAITWLVSFPLGIYAAIGQDKFPDYVLRTIAYALDALPSFVIAILLLTYLAVYLDWAPPVSYVQIWENPGEHLRVMILPIFVVGIGASGTLLRYTRAFMLEVMRQDYIRTARSKGLPERTVLMRHALRNVALPFITFFGNTIPLLLTSSAIIETLFSLPGMGRYLVDAAVGLDYTVVMTTTMFYAIIVMSTQLVTDLSYGWLDPRVSYDNV